MPETLLDKDIAELSGVEKQRIEIISAILLQKPIYLLDETTSVLDVDAIDLKLKTKRNDRN